MTARSWIPGRCSAGEQQPAGFENRCPPVAPFGGNKASPRVTSRHTADANPRDFPLSPVIARPVDSGGFESSRPDRRGRAREPRIPLESWPLGRSRTARSKASREKTIAERRPSCAQHGEHVGPSEGPASLHHVPPPRPRSRARPRIHDRRHPRAPMPPRARRRETPRRARARTAARSPPTCARRSPGRA